MPIHARKEDYEKAIGRPLTDAEYLKIVPGAAQPSMATARAPEAPSAPSTRGVQAPAPQPYVRQPFVIGARHDQQIGPAATMPSPVVRPYAAVLPIEDTKYRYGIEDKLPGNPPVQSQPVKPLFGLPPSSTTQEQKQQQFGPSWYGDQAIGAKGDVATAPEYMYGLEASKKKPEAPVATMVTPAPQQQMQSGTVVQVVPSQADTAMDRVADRAHSFGGALWERLNPSPKSVPEPQGAASYEVVDDEQNALKKKYSK